MKTFNQKILAQSFIEQTAIDYDMPVHEVERIARLFPDQFYENLEQHLIERANAN